MSQPRRRLAFDMRLLNATSLSFKEFLGHSIPKYDIVSHRWSDEELTFEDFATGKPQEGYGWTKIVKACEMARQQDYRWVWIDTICIDKKSSAELSEAINSMYTWYWRSDRCFVFLPHVHGVTECGCPTGEYHQTFEGCTPFCRRQFRASAWFTRGWTLQELLGPLEIEFFNCYFQTIGSKETMRTYLSRATHIATEYFERRERISGASIARKMSWASHRQTTWEEDRAYSLLGIFDVNMALLYGEGTKAFVRLQTQIIQKDTDQSIFAWWHPYKCDNIISEEGCSTGLQWAGLLAPSPDSFSEAANITPLAGEDAAEALQKR